jgi:hypothetical protein
MYLEVRLPFECGTPSRPPTISRGGSHEPADAVAGLPTRGKFGSRTGSSCFVEQVLSASVAPSSSFQFGGAHFPPHFPRRSRGPCPYHDPFLAALGLGCSLAGGTSSAAFLPHRQTCRPLNRAAPLAPSHRATSISRRLIPRPAHTWRRRLFARSLRPSAPAPHEAGLRDDRPCAGWPVSWGRL